MHCDNADDENRNRHYFKREMDVITSLNHKNCLKLYGCSAIPSNNYPILVFPYCNGGCLEDYILKEGKKPRLTNEQKYRVILEIAEGLAYMHSNNVIHRDLKSDNILMHNGHPVIADFGLSRKIDIGESIDILSSAGGDPK